jgi:tRNA threonylcarbamoyladenosine biosynthesis protein TsaB
VAFAAGLPAVPVSTLAALAQEAASVSGERNVLAALDARKGEVYWGQYRLSDNGLAVLQGEETVCPPEAVIPPGDDHWVGAGSGWQAHGERLVEQCGDSVARLLPDLEPHARSVALLGVAGFVNDRTVAPEDALPVYLRNNVADEKR